MKRFTFFSFTLLIFTLFTACGIQKQDSEYLIQKKETAFYDMAYNVYENGLLYTVDHVSGTQAYFLDYQIMNGVPLCNKPNCTHSDSSCISGLCARAFHVPVIYHDCVYWFTSDYKIVDAGDGKSQELEIHTKCMRAKLDSGTAEVFAEIDNVFMNSAVNLIVDKDKLYIIGSREMYQDPVDKTWAGFSRSGEQYLYSINLDSAEVRNYGRINDSPYAKHNWIHGASLFSEVTMSGVYNNKLYLYYRYVKDPKMITDFLDNDLFTKGSIRNDIPWVVENKCIDLETGEITVSDLPYAWCIGENYYVYEEDGTFYVFDESGKKTTAKNIYDNEIYDFTIINGKLWKGSIGQGFDIKTGNELYFADKYCDSGAMIMDFIDNQYIVKYYENDTVKFDKVSEDDLLKK